MSKFLEITRLDFFVRPGIGRRFALWILAFSSAVTLVLVVLQLTIEFKRDVLDIERLLVQIRDSNSSSLADDLWVVSRDGAQTHLDGLRQLPDMQYLELRTEKDQVFASTGTLLQGREILRQETPLYHLHRGKPVLVGKLVAVASLEGAYQRLRGKVVVILISQTIKTFLVSLFILFLFQMMVGRHLRKIASQAERIEAGRTAPALVLERSHAMDRQSDELGLLVRSLNSMHARLDVVYHDLRESEATTRRMIEEVVDYAILRLDRQGRVASWNLGAERIFGYSAAEVFGQHHSIFVASGDSAQGIPDQLLAWAEAQGQTAVEGWRVRKDGTAFWAECSLALLHGPDGKSLGYSMVVHDVTERRRAEFEQQRLTRSLRLLSDGNLILVHAEQEQELLNDVCRLAAEAGGYLMAWIGVPEQDEKKTVRIVARSGYEAGFLDGFRISWDAAQEIGCGPAGAAIRTKSTQIAQNIGKNPIMQPWRDALVQRGCQSVIVLPLVSHQQLLGVLTIYAAEADAFNSAEVALLDELSRNVAFGIESLRVHGRQQAAEAASQAKSDFLANMSHEIRTPLNVITGMASLVRRSGITPEQDERLEKIEAAGDHLLGIINAVLDMSKIEAGKFRLEEADVDLGSIPEHVATMLADRVQARNLKLVVEPLLQPLRVIADATRLKQALLNYAGNAVKFTVSGGITLRTRVEDVNADPVQVRFEVEDTGIGIASDTAARLFSPFEQGDNSATRKFGGTGLGLVITKKLAEMMGGSAGVDSMPGVGSTFWFTVRLRKSAVLAAAVVTESGESAEERLVRDCKGSRILLVEDEPFNRELAEEYMSVFSPQLDFAGNGSEALELASRNDYDLILMDMQMPVMGGLEATRRIRELSNRSGVPIIAMTGNVFAEDRKRSFDAGVNDFIGKPYKMEELYETLLRWLPRRPG